MFRQVRIHPLFDVRLRQAFATSSIRNEFVVQYLKGVLDEFADRFEDLPQSPLGPEWRRTYGVANLEGYEFAFTVLAREVAFDVVELRSIEAELCPGDAGQ